MKIKLNFKIVECLRKNRSLTNRTSSKFFISLNDLLGIIIDYNKDKEAKYLHLIQFSKNHNHNDLCQKFNLRNNNYSNSNNPKSSSNNLNNSNKTLEQAYFQIRYPRNKISWISSLTSVEGLLIYF